MATKKIGDLHQRLMKEFIKQISDLISNIPGSIPENKTNTPKVDCQSPPAIPTIKEVPPPPENHNGPDKINEIRNEVAATQSAQALNPNKQSELLEIVKRSSEEFEHELRRIVSHDDNTIESAAQKFKDELMENVHKQLTEKKYVFTD